MGDIYPTGNKNNRPRRRSSYGDAHHLIEEAVTSTVSHVFPIFRNFVTKSVPFINIDSSLAITLTLTPFTTILQISISSI